MAFASDLEDKSLAELHELAAARGVPRFRSLRRQELIEALGGDTESKPEIDTLDEALDELEAEGERESDEDEDEEEDEEEEDEEEEDEEDEDEEDEDEEEEEEDEDEVDVEEAKTATGVLEIVPDGFGFLRVEGFVRSHDDVFVARSQIRALELRSGDELGGPLRPRRRNDRHVSLAEVQTVNGRPVDDAPERPHFADLTPTFPAERLPLAGDLGDDTLRMVELVAAPVKGGRILIAGPPRSGTTSLLRKVLAAVRGSAAPIVVMVDARPEELAEWQRSVDYPVYGVAADAGADAGVELATVALERARRLVEQGDDVLLALDSITRLAHAHPARQRGGDDPPARAKRWFAAGRNTEEAGSLTIVATAHSLGPLHEALADIATAEVRLDPELAAAGNDPPIDVRHSFTRAEGVLAPEADQLRRLHAAVQGLPAREAWQHVADQIRY